MIVSRIRNWIRSMLFVDIKPVVIQLFDIKPCTLCGRPIATLDEFCKYCGSAQYPASDRQTTGHHFELLKQQQYKVDLLNTGDLRAIHAGSSRPMQTYRQVLRDREKE